MRHQKFYPAVSVFVFILLVVFTSNSVSAQAPANDDKCEPFPVEPFERKLLRGETHCFRFDLQKDQFSEIRLEQKGIDVALKIYDSDAKLMIEIDSPNGSKGFEILPIVAPASGVYKLEVTSSKESDTEKGAYKITRAAPRAATEKEKNQFQANVALMQAKNSSVPQEKKDFFQKALQLYKTAGDKNGEAVALTAFALSLLEAGDAATALSALNGAFKLYTEISETREAAVTLKYMGLIYYQAGYPKQAREKLEQAVAVFQNTDDENKGDAYLYIGNIYFQAAEYAQALENYEKGLALLRTTDFYRGLVDVLNNIGLVYRDTGKYRNALEKFREALEIAQKHNLEESALLVHIAASQADLNQKNESLESYKSAEAKIKDPKARAFLFLNMGKTQFDLGKKQEASDSFNQALTLLEKENEKAALGSAYNAVGRIYSADENLPKAVEYYNIGLKLQKFAGFRRGEGMTLYNLMIVAQRSGNNRLGIFYGKLAVNIYQQIRSNIQTFENESQRAFLKQVEDAYRQLAAALIDEGRISEAQEVMVLLKGEEFFQYSRRSTDSVPNLNRPIDLNPEETEAAKKYAGLTDEAEFLKFLQQELPEKFRRPAAAGSFEPANSQTRVWQQKLGALNDGTILLTTLVTPQRYYVIITSPTEQIARRYDIPKPDLQEKIKRSGKAVKNPQSLVNSSAQELYRIIVKPVEADLARLKAKTLLWSPDGALRYVSFAALHDGKNFLVEKYANAVVTLAQPAPNFKVSPENWRALGGGFSGAFEKLPALKYVPMELAEIVFDETAKNPKTEKGLFSGMVLLDQNFSRANLESSLKQKFQLIHFATHFVLNPGKELDSYLLLGNGEKLNLGDIRADKIFDFSGVDLLTLSACETDGDRLDADGVEIESFGVIAQKRGAKTVIASLWTIFDKSTPQLMGEFYRRYQTGKGAVSKAEALRQAQIALLKAGKAAPNTAHPAYWAPFIVLGEWR
jgi:CHAT domain-containing protein/uncharacterized protein HemY